MGTEIDARGPRKIFEGGVVKLGPQDKESIQKNID